VVRPPLLVSATISSRVSVWNSAALTMPLPMRFLLPISSVSLVAGFSPRFRPVAPSERYESSLMVGVSKPRPAEIHAFQLGSKAYFSAAAGSHLC
jgi:hypothetical protein